MLLKFNEFVKEEQLNEITYFIKNMLRMNKSLNKMKEEITDKKSDLRDETEKLLSIRKNKRNMGHEELADHQKDEIQKIRKEIEDRYEKVKQMDLEKSKLAKKQREAARKQLVEDPKKFWND